MAQVGTPRMSLRRPASAFGQFALSRNVFSANATKSMKVRFRGYRWCGVDGCPSLRGPVHLTVRREASCVARAVTFLGQQYV